MPLALAYIGVIIIWSTTPLAIKWSAEGAGFLFGVTARMMIGTFLCLMLARLLRVRIPWHAQARRAYFAAGVAIYGSMLCTYWSAQYVSSGLISVLFGLTPVMTGVMASGWLGEQSLTRAKIAGMITGLAGLAVVFETSLASGTNAAQGILGLLLAVLLYSVSTVWIKRIGADLPTLSMVAGGLVVSSSLYALTWLAMAPPWPAVLPLKTLSAIVYLGVFGSVIGFILYYYALKHLETGQIALITLITPVTALLLGHALNHEPITPDILLGTGLILIGLFVHQWGDFVARSRQPRLAAEEAE